MAQQSYNSLGYAVAEIADNGDWSKVSTISSCDSAACVLDPSGNTAFLVHGDGSFAVASDVHADATSVAGLDLLSASDDIAIVSFDSAGAAVSLTSFSDTPYTKTANRKGLTALSDGSLVWVGYNDTALVDGAGNSVSTPNVSGSDKGVFVAPLSDGPWASSTSTPDPVDPLQPGLPTYDVVTNASGSICAEH